MASRMIRALLLLAVLSTGAWAQGPLTAKTATVPPLNVQVAVGTTQRPQRGSFYGKTMDIQAKLTIDCPSRMLAIPELEATVVIITMDTRAKYTSRREVYKVHSTETITIPAVPVGDRRTFSFAESSVSFDAYRDSTNIGGEVYKYYVFGLREKSSGTLLDFKTNNVPAMTFCKAHPEKRDELLTLRKGADFPDKLK